MSHLLARCLLVSWLLSSGIFAESPDALVIKTPMEWQVTQRQSLTRGTLHIAGHSPANAAIEWRIAGQPPETWQALAPNSDKTDFSADVAVPAGGWFRLELRAQRGNETIAQSAVDHIGIGEVFVIAGQSNSANYGSEKQETKTGLVTSFDGKIWRVARDPQLGAGGAGGSFMPVFGDAMNTKFGVPIGLVPLGVGSTSVREWLPKGEKVDHLTPTGRRLTEIGPGEWEAVGDLFAKLSTRLKALGQKGCRAVLWHQGESDSHQREDRQITPDAYARYMTILIRASRQAAGWDVPWFTAQVSYHSIPDPSDPEFRAAQKSLWDNKLTFEGPDTDTLGADYRTGIHFNGLGLRKHGELWVEKVAPWVEEQLKHDQ